MQPFQHLIIKTQMSDQMRIQEYTTIMHVLLSKQN